MSYSTSAALRGHELDIMTESSLSVAFDHRIFTTQKYGGISRYFAAIAPLLRAHGCHPTIIAPLHINAYLNGLPHGIVWGARIPTFRGSSRVSLVIDRFMARPLAAACDARIVHETYYGARSYTPQGAATVLTVYDMIHELFPNLMPDERTRELKAAAIGRADRILCISESTRRDLLHFFPEVEARTSVTLLGFDGQFSVPVRPTQDVKRPYLLYVGPRSAYKNFASLLDAYAQSSFLAADFDLACIGGGSFIPAELQAIRRHGLEAKVLQYDANDTELVRWYGEAAAFVYPSLYEGFGIPPLEAMAAGCPVVAVRVSSVPEICGSAAEFADDGSAESLRVAIEGVVYSPTRLVELREAGRKRLTGFSWNRTAMETAAVYRELE
jgi:glycosyltransferase involved in cell wall biosynthesis